jgi:hypothetical protein
LRQLHDESDLRQSLAQRARARALESFSLRTNVDGLEQLYLDLRGAAAGEVSPPPA